MRAVIEGAGRSKVFFIRPPTDDGSAEVMVACADEGMDIIVHTNVSSDIRARGLVGSAQARCLHSLFSMMAVFSKSAKGEMERLAIARAGLVYPIENPGHSRYEGEPCKSLKILRSVERRRYQNLWHTTQSQSMKTSE